MISNVYPTHLISTLNILFHVILHLVTLLFWPYHLYALQFLLKVTKLRIIRIPTTTASIIVPVKVGMRIVFNMSLPIAKSSASSNPLANRALIVTQYVVRPSFFIVKCFKKEAKAKIADIPITSPTATSITIVIKVK